MDHFELTASNSLEPVKHNTRLRWRRLILKYMAPLLTIGFIGLYSLTARAKIQVTDEVAVFASAVALATRGELSIDELQWLQDADNIGQHGPDGRLYAKYFPGNILCGAGLYALGAQLDPQPTHPFVWNYKTLAPSLRSARLVLRLNALLGAVALGALYWLLAREFSPRVALLTTLCFGLGSDWWYQSRGFLSEVGAGCLIILSLALARRERFYWSSLTLSLAMLFRPLSVLALPVYLLNWRRLDRRQLGSLLGLGVGPAVLAIYNFLRFGSPFNFGYGAEGFKAMLWEGLYGLLLSPGRSIFVYSPVLLLAAPGMYWLYQRDRRLALASGLPILAHLVVIAVWHQWDGGWTWGSRLLTPILPLCGVLLAPAIERARARQSWRWVWGILGISLLLGIGVQLATLTRDPVWVLIDNVQHAGLPYKETLYTIHNSWLALQVRAAQAWQPCTLDAMALRELWAVCR